jgi:hypothetical protein
MNRLDIMHLNQRFSRACIVHLVIKRTDWCYVKTMSCSGSHLGITINIKNPKWKIWCLGSIWGRKHELRLNTLIFISKWSIWKARNKVKYDKIHIKNPKFVKDLPMIDAQFRFNQCNSFREEYISVFSPYGLVLILWPVVAAILDFRSTVNDTGSWEPLV